MKDIPKELLRIIGKYPENLASFAYGSRIEGFSNKNSDLDVAVITKSKLHTGFVKIKEIEVDIVHIPLSNLNELIRLAKQNRVDQHAILWCHRIVTGHSICDNKGVFQELQKKIDIKRLSHSLINSYSAQAIMYLNDSLGAFESEDYETALITARLGVETASMAYLASMGIINPRSKWIYRYLLRISKSEENELLKQFKMLERACANGAEEIRRYIECASDFVNGRITEAQMSKVTG